MYGISKAECDFEMKYYLIIPFFIDDYFLCPSYFLHGLTLQILPRSHWFHALQKTHFQLI